MADKIIFLDIDGVLVTRESRQRFNSARVFSPECVMVLKSIVEKTGAKIVISSTWRFHGNWEESIRERFAVAGWPDPPIVDKTPILVDFPGFRGDEISAWLLAPPEVECFIIIDDVNDFAPDQLPRFVQTDAGEGLTMAHRDRCITLLGPKTEDTK